MHRADIPGARHQRRGRATTLKFGQQGATPVAVGANDAEAPPHAARPSGSRPGVVEATAIYTSDGSKRLKQRIATALVTTVLASIPMLIFALYLLAR